MKRPKISIGGLDADLSAIDAPFAALIDTNDQEWNEAHTARRLGKRLLAAGCRYFICFGPSSEAVHDILDDLIVEEDHRGVTTTFHDDEAPEEVADFLVNCAAKEVRSGLVFVERVSQWKPYFRGATIGRS